MIVIGMDQHRSHGHTMAFAMYIHGSTFKGKKIFTELDPSEVVEILIHVNPDYLVVDHINELLSDPVITKFLQNCMDANNNSEVRTVQITVNSHSRFTSIRNLIRKYHLPLTHKPDPLTTAILCVLFFEKGEGLEVDLNTRQFNFSYSTIPSVMSRKGNQVRRSERNLEYYHRYGYSFVTNFPKVDHIIETVAMGKESNVYLVQGVDRDIMILKLFRNYSPTARANLSNITGINSGNVANALAKREFKFLRRLSRCGLMVPKPLFQEGPVVCMDPIVVGEGNSEKELNYLAPPLSRISVNLQKEKILDLIYQTFSLLENLFFTQKIVHGDFSAYNLLFDGTNLHLIDFAQVKQINFNTYLPTPQRIGMLEASTILLKDITAIIKFYERKFSITLEKDTILKEFSKNIPREYLSKNFSIKSQSR